MEVDNTSRGSTPSTNSENSKKRKETSEIPTNVQTQEEIDKERGFNEEELKTCLKVLNCFKESEARLQLLQQKRYKPLRGAGLIFVEGISSRYFRGQGVQEYSRNKQRKIEKKRRKKEQEDKRLLAKAAMREKKLKNLEKLIEDNPQLALLDSPTPLIAMPSEKDTRIVEEIDDVQPNDSLMELDDEEDPNVSDTKPTPSEDDSMLHTARECYICKVNYWQVHHFYDKLCPTCADLNWSKRNQQCNMKGRYCLVTGARVKIGWWTALILLRNGAFVIATSRFPHDAALRFAKEPDYNDWKDRLHIYGLDMRYLKDVEKFCDMLIATYPRLDVIINNAAQTVRRPPAYYEHLMSTELKPLTDLPEAARYIVKSNCPSNDALLTTTSTLQLEANEQQKETTSISISTVEQPTSSAIYSQMALIPEDNIKDPKIFPPGKYDEDNQQLDLRRKTTWVLEHDQVSSVELAEVHAINTIAPYIINSKLMPLMKQTPENDRFIVNVSSVEGQFYHKKTTRHPHTNMAKAALNMMTRTSAAYYAKQKIWMTSVDTGWISDMNPVQRSSKIAKKYGEHFRNPLDEVDGAARVLDPVFDRLNNGRLVFGRFLKDYTICPW